jgi:hypothetical protein
MAAFSTLALLLAGAIAGGVAASKLGGNRPATPVPAGSRRAPAGAATGQAKPRTAPTATPGIPTPPDALKAASANTAAAAAAGLRMRRRAAAGSAGRISVGKPSLLQQTIRASEIPRTLLGS